MSTRMVFFAPSVTGSGQVVRACAVGNALRRAGLAVDFTIVTGSEHTRLATRLGFPVVPFDVSCCEGDAEAAGAFCFEQLSPFKADILVVDQSWFFVQLMPGPVAANTLLLVRRLFPDFFNLDLKSGSLPFDSSCFDRVIGIEPGHPDVADLSIDPVVVRNRSEIHTREQARESLGIGMDERVCLVTTNGRAGELDALERHAAAYVRDGYRLIRSTNTPGPTTGSGEHLDLYPVVDYHLAFDAVVTSAGYNSFWEARMSGIPARYVSQPRAFEDQAARARELRDHLPGDNGADQLVSMLGLSTR